MQAFSGSVWRPIITAKAYVGGAWRTLTIGKVYKGGAWRNAATFVLPMSLALTPDPANKGGSGYVSRSVTATPTGGLGPFTYNWTIIASAGPTSVALGSASSATATASGDVSSGDFSFTLQCTAIDSLGTTVTAQVSGGLFDNGRSGGRYL